MYLKYFTHPYVIPNLSAVNYFAHKISKAVYIYILFFRKTFFVWYSDHVARNSKIFKMVHMTQALCSKPSVVKILDFSSTSNLLYVFTYNK